MLEWMNFNKSMMKNSRKNMKNIGILSMFMKENLELYLSHIKRLLSINN
jgi:hypothetical protein